MRRERERFGGLLEEREEGRERKGRRGKERFESEGLGGEEEEVVVGEEGVGGGGGGGNEC